MAQNFLLAEDIDELINQKEKPVVIDFLQISSVPCAMYAPRLAFAREKLEELGLALFGTVDISESQTVFDRFSVISVPTTLIFWQGEIVKQYIGIQEPIVIIEAVYGILGKEMPKEEPK